MLRALLLATAALLASACGHAPAPTQAGCPPDMVEFPAGSFEFAMKEGVRAVVAAPFCLDVTEVTVAAYAACVARGGCTPARDEADWPGISDADRLRSRKRCNGERADRADHPVNCVTWDQAAAYCRALRRRLPTEAEWEWAARGGAEARHFPWGSEPPARQVCWNLRPDGAPDADWPGTCAVGSHPEGAGPGGLQDLAGNVWEWTSSANREGARERVTRGGGFSYQGPEVVSVGYRGWNIPGQRDPAIGFRCAKDR
jgi:formylglycine-generating enzyme required for sulfatase activity